MRAPVELGADTVDQLLERLFVMYLGGRWMAPLSERMVPMPGLSRARLACAGAGDLARARLRPGPVDGAALRAAYAEAADELRHLRAFEGMVDPVAAPEEFRLDGPGPLVLLSARDVPLSRIAGLLIAGAGRGLLWKPAPGAAASAHSLVRALAPAVGAGLALVQGDHATGALAAGQGAVIWASEAPPPAGLPVSLCVRATG